MTCACPQHPGRLVTDLAAHTAWHQLVIDQGGPADVVNTVTLRAARGYSTETPRASTLVDDRAVASGKRRAGQHSYLEARARENARKAAAAGLTSDREEVELWTDRM